MAENEDGLKIDSISKKADKKSMSYYLDQLPLSDSAKIAANKQIENAMFHLAKVYREQFVDYNKSEETYNKLLKRYPNTEYELESFFRLYQLYKLQNQEAEAEEYKQKILNDYPNSVPAKILSDPNYLVKMEAEKNKTKGIYLKTFESFQKRQFTKVLKYCTYVEENNPETPLMPKFKLLKAQSIGASGNVDAMKEELKNIESSYPSTEEQELANFMLTRIEAGGYTNFATDNNTASSSSSSNNTNTSSENNHTNESTNDLIEDVALENIYVFEPELPHKYIMAATGEISDLNRLKYNIIKYNIDNFLMFDFKVADRKLTKDTKLIIVKPLNNAKEAYKYLKLIRKNKEIYSDFPSLQMQQFIITDKNLKILLKEKDLRRYQMFFEQNYHK